MRGDEAAVRSRPAGWTSGIRWAGLSQVTRQAALVVGLILLSRFVSPSDFGLMAMALVVTGLVVVVRDLGLAPAIVRAPTLSNELSTTAFWMNATTGLLLAVCLVALAPLIAGLFNEPALTAILAVMAVPVLIGSLSTVQQARLERALRFRELAVVEIGSQVTGLAIALGVAVAGAGVWSLVAQSLVTTCTFTLSLWLVARWRPGFRIDLAIAREAWAYSRGFVVFTLLNFLARNADNAIVGAIAGSTALGYYSVAYRIMMLPLLTAAAVVNRVQFPLIAADITTTLGAWHVFRSALVVVSVTAMPISVVISATADRLVLVLLGPEWMPVAPILRWLAIAGALQVVAAVMGPIYLAAGQTSLLARWGIVSTAVVLVAFVVGVAWGAEGVAVAYAIASGLLVYPALALAMPMLGRRPIDALRIVAPIGGIAIVAGVAAVAVGAILDGRTADIVILAAQLGTAAVVFLGLMALARARDLAESLALFGISWPTSEMVR